MHHRVKYFYITLSIIALSAYAFFVSAAFPATQYNPGESQDPACAPNAANCSVAVPWLTDQVNGFLYSDNVLHNRVIIFGDTDTAWDPGANTEENKLFFDRDHQVVRIGSVDDDRWDPGQVGARSIAIGFADPTLGFGFGTGPDASGYDSIAIGTYAEANNQLTLAIGAGSVASGIQSFAMQGGNASGTSSFALQGAASGSGAIAIGRLTLASDNHAVAIGNDTQAIGNNAVAIGQLARANGFQSFAAGANAIAIGDESIAIGNTATAASFREIAVGQGTDYTGMVATVAAGDRLFTIGNSGHDAVMVLKNGKTGIGFDHFESVNNTELLQVNGDIRASGGIVQTSDRRLKDNIQDIPYGLDTVNQLHGVAYDLKQNGSHQLGFIAQEIQSIIPELVAAGDYLALNYQGFIPILAKAVQELDAKFEMMGHYFKSDRIETDELCVGDVCVSREQFMQVFGAGLGAGDDQAHHQDDSDDAGAGVTEPAIIDTPDPAPAS